MIQWEYKICLMSSIQEDNERLLNDYGRQGWEVVCVYLNIRVILKRRLD